MVYFSTDFPARSWKTYPHPYLSRYVERGFFGCVERGFWRCVLGCMCSCRPEPGDVWTKASTRSCTEPRSFASHDGRHVSGRAVLLSTLSPTPARIGIDEPLRSCGTLTRTLGVKKSPKVPYCTALSQQILSLGLNERVQPFTCSTSIFLDMQQSQVIADFVRIVSSAWALMEVQPRAPERGNR